MNDFFDLLKNDPKKRGQFIIIVIVGIAVLAVFFFVSGLLTKEENETYIERDPRLNNSPGLVSQSDKLQSRFSTEKSLLTGNLREMQEDLSRMKEEWKEYQRKNRNELQSLLSEIRKLERGMVALKSANTSSENTTRESRELQRLKEQLKAEKSKSEKKETESKIRREYDQKLEQLEELLDEERRKNSEAFFQNLENQKSTVSVEIEESTNDNPTFVYRAEGVQEEFETVPDDKWGNEQVTETSHIKARVLNGVLAPENKSVPVILKANWSFNSPNGYRYNFNNCRLLGEAIADIGQLRADISIYRIVCIKDNKVVFRYPKNPEEKINFGFIESVADHYKGIKGEYVTSKGEEILARFAGDTFGAIRDSNLVRTTQTGTSGASQVVESVSNNTDLSTFALAQGASGAINSAIDWYVKRAQESIGAIAVPGGTEVIVWLTEPIVVEGLYEE